MSDATGEYKYGVLGAGRQGTAAAYDLAVRGEAAAIVLADIDGPRAEAAAARVNQLAGRAVATGVALDAGDSRAVLEFLRPLDAAIGAISYKLNLGFTEAALQAGTDWCDLGGNTEIVFEQKKLDGAATAKGLSIIPDCGLAPGMVAILAAEGIRRLDKTERVRIYVGGLPQNPEPPLNYQIVYSLEGALDYYTTPSWVLRGGKPAQVDALSELETIEFPKPVGPLEAFHTAGGISTLPFKYEGQVDVMEYKTLRYPGHVAIMRPIRELGLLENSPITVKGQQVVPRDVFIAAVHPKLHKPQGRDLVALLIKVSGTKGGKKTDVTFRLIDYYDAEHGISAMMRATAYSLSITGQMQADGRVTLKGVHTPDEAVPFADYVAGLAARGVVIEEL